MEKKVLWNWDEELSNEKIIELEKLWNIKFPKEYVEIIKAHHGASVRMEIDGVLYIHCGIDIPKWHGGRAGVRLADYEGCDGIETWEIVHSYEAFKECLPEPEKIFPFADDGGGNHYFFDYRDNDTEPSIVFLDHGESIIEDELDEDELEERTVAEWQDLTLYKVADSFSEFLDKITPPID
ncbi:SMI1/KNR4 family protein [Clostridium bornimense]|uniref:SMI1/KNR4 family protein n=1 Tax=Clostridium bornimense TaxID=1216932 RepID=UPI001C111004|nr:SMI1/KNR4 family protein [Clostridium bornimense]MBU5316210.1 SMI1/KNR4 family protein [Clostridium bornimense]